MRKPLFELGVQLGRYRLISAVLNLKQHTRLRNRARRLRENAQLLPVVPCKQQS